MASVFGKGVARLCGVLAASTAAELRRLLAQGLRETPTVEVRLDWLKNDGERHAFLGWLKNHLPGKAQVIATCRRRVGGGELAGDAGAELFWLMKAREAGCAWCDLEIETLRELPGKTVRGYAIPEKVLLSMHDFRKTPKFPKRLSLPARGGANAIKVAAMARSLQDSARTLRVARNSRDVVAVAMGEIGLPARVLALRQGSALAYGSVASATAPGQIPLLDLKNLYRAHELTQSTRIYGVIGNPIAHSLSPLLHNTGYVAARQDAVLLPFLVENLRDFLKSLPDFSLRGFCVTLPHKEKILAHLDDVEPLAEKIGAVNTVTVGRNGALYGSNTDYLGVLWALEKKMKLRGSRVVIFGAGGSARAAAFALEHAGAACVYLRPAARGGSETREGRGRRGHPSLSTADSEIRCTGKFHSDWHASTGKDFAAGGRRVKLFPRHGSYLQANADQTSELGGFARNRLRLRRGNVPGAGLRPVGTLDGPQGARVRGCETPCCAR